MPHRTEKGRPTAVFLMETERFPGGGDKNKTLENKGAAAFCKNYLKLAKIWN